LARNELGGLQGFGLFLFILGVLLDFGVIGGSAKARRREG
jgi:hypothetical protein